MSAPLTLCRRTHTVALATKSVELSHLSFRLLALLAERAPEPVPFDDIDAFVWGHAVTRDTVKQRVRLVRASLGRIGLPSTAIASAHGFGYRLTTYAIFEPRPPASSPGDRARSDSSATSPRPPAARRGLRRPAISPAAVAAAVLLAVAGGAFIPFGLQWPSPTTSATSEKLRVAVHADRASFAQQARRRVRAHLQAGASTEVADAGARDLLVRIHAAPSMNGATLRFVLFDGDGLTVLWSERYDRAPVDADRAALHFLRSAHAILERRLWSDRMAASTPGEWPNPLLDVILLLNAPSPANLARADAVLRRLAAPLDLEPPSPRSADRALAVLLSAHLLAERALRQGRPFARNAAVTAARAVASRYPEDPYVSYRLARVELAAGDHDAALARLRAVQAQLPWTRRDIGGLASARGPVF